MWPGFPNLWAALAWATLHARLRVYSSPVR